jgi:hypothetical protein
VKQRHDAGLHHHPIGDVLEDLGVDDLVEEDPLARAHVLGAPLELGTDPAGVHRLAAGPIPGEGPDHGLGDDSSEAAVALDEHGLHALSRRCQRRGETPRSSSHHQDVGLGDDRNSPGRLFDRLHAGHLPGISRATAAGKHTVAAGSLDCTK